MNVQWLLAVIYEKCRMQKVRTLCERKYIMVNGVQQAQGYDVDESA